jgi:hypothetical protein
MVPMMFLCSGRISRSLRRPAAPLTHFSEEKTKTPGGQGWLRAQYDLTMCNVREAGRLVNS